MQGPIAQALALTCVGNAFLRGRDVGNFWPNASVFQFSKSCEFLTPDASAEHGYRPIADDPLAWFELLKPQCRGLRLHAVPRQAQPGQVGHIEERMLIGFVGGGPRWLIETAGEGPSELWEGFNRLLDRNDPQRKIWGDAYLLQGETAPQDLAAVSIAAAMHDVESALVEIEAFATEAAPAWAENFRDARRLLRSDSTEAPFYADIADLADLSAETRRLLVVLERAWVFGGMGSWNDVVPESAYSDRYAKVSEALFRALIDAVATIANSTFPGR